MNEIEKMYENAGVLKECLSPCYINKAWRRAHNCPNCDNRENYPPFTAEKQLKLIKWLLKKDITDGSIITYFPRKEKYFCLFDWKDGLPESDLFENFEDALACVFNYIWQDLTEEEKQQVKGILE